MLHPPFGVLAAATGLLVGVGRWFGRRCWLRIDLPFALEALPALPQRLAELLFFGFVEVAEHSATAPQRPQVAPLVDVGEAGAPGEEAGDDLHL